MNRGNVEREICRSCRALIPSACSRCLTYARPQSEGQDGSPTRGQLDGGIGDQSIEIAADAEIIPEWNTRTV